MPSVRLRGSAYSSLRGSPTTSPSPRTLTGLLIQNAQSMGDSISSAGPNSSRMLRQSMPSLRPQPESDSEKTPHPTRSRSGTTNCRISNYIAERSRQYSRSPASDGSSEPGLGTSSPLLSPHDTRITHDSPQAEVVDHTSGALGAVGSVISFVDSGNDSDDSSSLNLHHDEIVDHLDVIDPQIGTVSSLANAANALLIPPNFWYCRRPVVEINYQPCPTSEGTLESRGGERPDKQLQDSLDRHVDDVLRNPSRFRRTMLGVWSFLKTRKFLYILFLHTYSPVFP
ncbi:hypothetical protein H2248_006451 [Termitomyces sp. 'cryptogamus']|nr:hypothetical protein H2248_006451 [Termitomyces sp. 'cryptogamus']